jgi:NADPH2:quinone reductase
MTGEPPAGTIAMKAARCHRWGMPETLVVEEVARSALRPHEARIRVRAAGVNFADSLMVARQYQVKPAFPFIPGLEAAGEVVETGAAVKGLRPGQRIMMFLRHGGGYAEEIVIDPAATAFAAIPDEMDFATAAAFPVAYGTAHFALTHRGGLRPGETLLVLGAAGGVGLAAVEIGKNLGARVIAAAGTPEKLAVARDHGADELIDYRNESIRDRVRDLTQGRGADVVFDPVGGDAFDQALRAVNWEARMLVVGFAAGRIQAVPANLVLVKNISVVGVVWGEQAARDPGGTGRDLAALLRWWEAGRLHPLVAQVFPLAGAGAALRALLSRRYAGKIVLEA